MYIKTVEFGKLVERHALNDYAKNQVINLLSDYNKFINADNRIEAVKKTFEIYLLFESFLTDDCCSINSSENDIIILLKRGCYDDALKAASFIKRNKLTFKSVIINMISFGYKPFRAVKRIHHYRVLK